MSFPPYPTFIGVVEPSLLYASVSCVKWFVWCCLFFLRFGTPRDSARGALARGHARARVLCGTLRAARSTAQFPQPVIWHGVPVPPSASFLRVFSSSFPHFSFFFLTFSLATWRHFSCFSTLLSPSPLKSPSLFFNFQAQILYFLYKCASSTFKLLQFVQFHSTHLSLSLFKTLTSIVEVEGCRERKSSICSFFILLASFNTPIFNLFLQNHYGQETSV